MSIHYSDEQIRNITRQASDVTRTFYTEQQVRNALTNCPPNHSIRFHLGWHYYYPNQQSNGSTPAALGGRSVDVSQAHPTVAAFMFNPFARSTPAPAPKAPPTQTPTSPLPEVPNPLRARILPRPSTPPPLPASSEMKEAVARLQPEKPQPSPSEDTQDLVLSGYAKSLERLRRRQAAQQPFQLDTMVHDVVRAASEFAQGAGEAICEGRHDPRNALRGVDRRDALDIAASGHAAEAALRGTAQVAVAISDTEHNLVEGDAHNQGRAAVELTGDVLAAATTARLLPRAPVRAATQIVSTIAAQVCDETPSGRTARAEVRHASHAIRADLVERPEVTQQVEDAGPGADIPLPQGWHRREFQESTVFQVDALIDRARIDRRPLLSGEPNPTYGWTNAERMASGFAPIGADGQPVRVQQMSSGRNHYVEVPGSAPRGDEFRRALPLAQESAYWGGR